MNRDSDDLEQTPDSERPDSETPGTPQPFNTAEIQLEHDTPPPVLIFQGSLIIETDQSTFDEEAVGGGRRKHRRFPKRSGRNRVFPAHIKIIDGSGDLLYRNDRAATCRTVITLENNDEVVLSAVGPNFEIDIPATNRTLVKSPDQFDQPIPHHNSVIPPRLARYRYKDNAGNQFKITRATVTGNSPNDILFNMLLSDLTSKGEEFRVMIWLEEA